MKTLIPLLLIASLSSAQSTDLIVSGRVSPGIGPDSPTGYSLGVGAVKGSKAFTLDLGLIGKQKPDRFSVGLSVLLVRERFAVGLGPEFSISTSVVAGLRASVLSNSEKFMGGLTYGRFTGLGLWVGLKW